MRSRWLALTLGMLSALTVLGAGIAVVRAGWSWADALDAFVLTNAAMGLAFGICGAVLAWHRPRNSIGWLFAVGGLLQAIAALCPPLGTLLQEAEAATFLLRLVGTIFVYSWPWAIGLCIPLALLLFPDGRAVTRRWRPLLTAVVVTAPLFALEMGAAPTPVVEGYPVGYLTLPFYDDVQPLWMVAEIRTLAAYVLALVALVVRHRRGSEATRRQLLWLLLAVIAVIITTIPWGLVAGTPIAVLFSITLIPLAVTVAIVRHRLLDIRLVASRALAWLLLSLAVVVAYVGLVALLDEVISTQLGRSAAATVLLVLVAAPVLPRLQRLVDRAMYGDRANPALVVSRLGMQLATPESGLAGVARSIRQALRLPYADIRAGEQVLAADGVSPEHVVSEPLAYAGQVVGHLTIGLRNGELRLGEADRRVIELLAAPLAVAVHAEAVSAELQASREQLIGAREEERRRLRRELHDGLGPALTGIAFTADAAANVVADQAQVSNLLDALRRDTRAALTDVRRVVEDLRPPALDELGLVGALRQRAEQLSRRADGTSVQVRVEVAEELPPLPAAVEVAAYRVATEALTNIARHSGATGAIVRLRSGDRLEVSINDDGPPNGAWRPGVGLRAMQERTTELGGEFEAGPSPAGGRVRASFPLVSSR